MSNIVPVSVRSDFEQLYPDASGRATECAMNLVLTTDLLTSQIARLLRPFDLTPASALVLSLLADAEDSLPPHEIAQRLIVSRAAVTGLIDSLEKREYVRRRPHPTDRRMLQVEITRKGRKVAQDFRPIVHRHQRMWFQTLGEQEQDRLIGFLGRVQTSLREAQEV